MYKVLIVVVMTASLLYAQEEKKRDFWKPLKFFIGSWEGTGKGEPGISSVEREYQFVLDGKYLFAKNKSTYEPQEKNPKGEKHEDWGIFSYDRSRRFFVLRQFHVEGFANQYVLDTLNSDSTKLVFITEGIENIPAGWRAKETYQILNENEFIETFELAEPGKDFAVYSENHLKRKKK